MVQTRYGCVQGDPSETTVAVDQRGIPSVKRGPAAVTEHGRKYGTICTLYRMVDEHISSGVCGSVAIATWNNHERKWFIQCRGVHESQPVEVVSLTGRETWALL